MAMNWEQIRRWLLCDVGGKPLLDELAKRIGHALMADEERASRSTP